MFELVRRILFVFRHGRGFSAIAYKASLSTRDNFGAASVLLVVGLVRISLEATYVGVVEGAQGGWLPLGGPGYSTVCGRRFSF